MAKSLEAQLAEVEAEIARVEATNAAYKKSKEYLDKLSALKAREKTAEANAEEAKERAARMEVEVLRAARIRHPTYDDKLHPDFISAIEKLTGVKYGRWETIGQENRTNGPEANPVAALIVKMRQEALAASPGYMKAERTADAAHEASVNAWRERNDFECKLPLPDPWRRKEDARILRDKIRRRDDAKARPIEDKKEKARLIESRNKVLAIVRGEGEFKW